MRQLSLKYETQQKAMNIGTNLLVQRNPQHLIYQRMKNFMSVNFAHKRNSEPETLKEFELIYMKNFLKYYTYFSSFLNRRHWIYCHLSLIPKDSHFEGHIIIYDDIFQFPHFGFSAFPIKNRLLTVTSLFPITAM